MGHYHRFLPLIFLVLIAEFGLTACGGAAATNQDPAVNAPSIQFSATPSTIASGELTTISWSTLGAASVTVSPNLNEDDDGVQLPTSGSVTVSLNNTTTYTLTAAAANGTASSKSIVVTVTPAATTISLSADPANVIAGQASTLTWTSKNATSVTIDPGIGNVALSGSRPVSPVQTTTYTATAQGASGTQSATATVTVASPSQLAVVLTASPANISPGGQATLTWQSQNATSVEITDVGAVPQSGSVSVSPSATRTYTATAKNAEGEVATASTTVTVLGSADGIANIKHIIFFVQENRSFDNYFGKLGAYRAAKGFANDIDAFDPNLVLTDIAGHPVSPFHQRTQRTENLSPGWNESHFYVGYRNGTLGMDAWMKQETPSIPSTIDPHYTRTLGYYDQSDIPYYYELATQFATSDRFFSSAMSGTIVNRTFIFSGTSAGMIRPTDPFPTKLATIFRRLTEAGITWRYYYQDGSVFLAQYTCGGECDWDRYQNNVWNISNYFDILGRPTADRDLPEVIFIQHSSGEKGPATALDEHPGHNVQQGVAQAEKIIDALLKSAAWPSSVFILTHDEGGGLYDHVPPFAVSNPDGITPILRADDIGTWDNFTYSGFRVPLIVISPWVRPHFVSHRNRDFTSILKLIENRHNLAPLTTRDAEADDMTEFFDFSKPQWLTPPPIPQQPTNGVDDIRLEEAPNHPD